MPSRYAIPCPTHTIKFPPVPPLITATIKPNPIKTSQTALFPVASLPSLFIFFLIRLVVRVAACGATSCSSQPSCKSGAAPGAATPLIHVGNRILSLPNICRTNPPASAPGHRFLSFALFLFSRFFKGVFRHYHGRPIAERSVRAKEFQPKAKIIFLRCAFMAVRLSWLTSVATAVL